MKQISLSNQKGFTLIELMVSLTLFTVIVVAVVSSLYSVNNASRKVESMRTVLDNVNFAVESMTRTIRTGSDIICGGTSNGSSDHNCEFGIDSPSDQLLVHSTIGSTRDIEYRLAPNAQYSGEGEIERRTKEGGVWGNWVALTAPEINIKRLSFYVNGANSTDLIQPSVIMLVEGEASVAQNDPSPFAIQTYISQRAGEE